MMTEKAKAVLQKMKLRRLFQNPKAKNQFTSVEEGAVGGDQEMKVLSEMNELIDDHDKFVKSSPRI
jgi:hypothetical protein